LFGVSARETAIEGPGTCDAASFRGTSPKQDPERRFAMGKHVRMTMLAVAMIGVATGSAWGQVPPPRPAPGVERPADKMTPMTTGMVEGTVQKVDPSSRTVRVSSGWFGLFGKTLEIVPDTRISVDGRDSTITQVREGTKVKASYETRDGRLIATQIETMPSDQGVSGRSS